MRSNPRYTLLRVLPPLEDAMDALQHPLGYTPLYTGRIRERGDACSAWSIPRHPWIYPLRAYHQGWCAGEHCSRWPLAIGLLQHPEGLEYPLIPSMGCGLHEGCSASRVAAHHAGVAIEDGVLHTIPYPYTPCSMGLYTTPHTL